MRLTPVRRARLSVEQLEGRDVPAGTVTTAVSHGNLVITGDAADNQITISQTAAGQVTITGTGGTSVNGVVDGASTKSFIGDLVIKLRGGNDTVSFDLTNPIDLPHNLTVSYGAKDTGIKTTQTINAGGNDLIVGRNLAVTYAAGSVKTTLDNLNVTGNVTVEHASGDGTFTADSKAAAGIFAHIGGSLSVTNNLGKATNVLADVSVDKNVTFSNGKAAVGGTAGETTIANAVNTALMTIGGNIKVSNATGDAAGGDRVGDVHVRGNVSLALGSGTFSATVANVLGAAATAIDGSLSVTGGKDGTDTVTLGAGGAAVALTVGKNLTIKPGTHAATVSIDATAINGNTSITTGSEADTIAIDGAASDEGSVFAGSFAVSTGAGTDTLSIHSGAANLGTTDFEGKVSVNLGADNDTLNLATAGVVNFLAPANVPVVFDGGAGKGDVNSKNATAANVQGTHPAPTFKNFA